MIDRKTQRKNKTNLVMKWPSHDEYFTIKSLLEANPEFIKITLRVRVKKAIDELKTVVEIGSKNVKDGRPYKAYAMAPASKLALEKAHNDGIVPPSGMSLPIIQVNSNTPITLVSSQPTVKNITTPKEVAVNG